MDNYSERILRTVSKIMFKNSHLFPIVDAIIKAKDFYRIQDKDAESYIIMTIEQRTGLRYIVNHKVECTNEIRWHISNEIDLEKALIKTILVEFISMNDPKIIKEFMDKL